MSFPSRAWDEVYKKKGSVQLRKLLNFNLDVGCSYPFALAPILPAQSLKSSRMI